MKYIVDPATNINGTTTIPIYTFASIYRGLEKVTESRGEEKISRAETQPVEKISRLGGC